MSLLTAPLVEPTEVLGVSADKLRDRYLLLQVRLYTSTLDLKAHLHTVVLAATWVGVMAYIVAQVGADTHQFKQHLPH